MKRGLSDTHPKMERKLIELNRAMEPARRLAAACALTDTVYKMSRAAIERAHPRLDARERDLMFIRINYGQDLAGRVRAYLAGKEGAWARRLRLSLPFGRWPGRSSRLAWRSHRRFHCEFLPRPGAIDNGRGHHRRSQTPAHRPPVTMLEQDYYIDGDMIAEAIRRQSFFNIIYMPLAFKVDIFIPRARPYDAAAQKRVVQGEFPGETERRYPMASAGDVILNKLDWYRIGGETSERQWNDVLEVIRTQHDRLDRAYLAKWAASLNFADLLDRALIKAVIDD